MEFLEKCVFCNDVIFGWGNNPSPVVYEGTCCDVCNTILVIPARMDKLRESVDQINSK